MKKKYKVEHYSKKETWKSARGFGGSSVSALLGNNPYMNSLDIYCAVVNPSEEKNDKQTASTIYGTNAEKPVALLFALHYPEYKLKYPKDITMYRRIDKPYMTYTADSILLEVPSGRKGIYEGKTHLVRSKNDADEWKKGNLPKNYVNQVLQGLAVLNDCEFVELCVELIYVDYNTNKYLKSELLSFHLERSDDGVQEAISKIEQIQTDFYENNIVKRIPPDIEINVEIGE